MKCATITPNKKGWKNISLKNVEKSECDNSGYFDGTVFRTPILIESIKPVVRTWKKPITIARHAYGDVYKGTEFRIPGKGKAELLFTAEDGSEMRDTIYDFESPGVLQGIYNKDSSISSFAHSCFRYALNSKQNLWFSAKDTISKNMTGLFELYLKKSMRIIIDVTLKMKGSLIFIHLSMMLSLGLCDPRADLSGHARIMTAM